jgi:hypothetical protein
MGTAIFNGCGSSGDSNLNSPEQSGEVSSEIPFSSQLSSSNGSQLDFSSALVSSDGSMSGEFSSESVGSSQEVGSSFNLSNEVPVSSGASSVEEGSSTHTFSSSESLQDISSSSVENAGNPCDNAISSEISAQLGQYGPEYSAIDKNGNVVRLCELAGEKPILISLATESCPFCRHLAQEISSGGNSDWFPDELMGRINNDEIVFVEMILSVGQSALESWEREYPHDKVTLLADNTGEFNNLIGAGAVPDMLILDQQYRWQLIRTFGHSIEEILGVTNYYLSTLY